MDDLTMLRDLGRDLEHEPPAALVRQRQRLLDGARPRRRLSFGSGITRWAVIGLAAAVTAAVVVVPTLLMSGRQLAVAPIGDRPDKLTSDLNVLLVGTDSETGSPRHRLPGGPRSDTMLLVHVPADQSKALVISIPRDSIVRLPACAAPDGGPGMINQALAKGGLNCAWETVESLTKVRIDHAVQLDFSGFAEIVDALGGVRVMLREPVDDRNSKLTLSSGWHNLTGKQAVGYVRLRHYGDGSDVSRIKRQQVVMLAMLKKAKSTLADPGRLTAALTAMKKSVVTDPEFDVSTMSAIAHSLTEDGRDPVAFVTVPVGPYPDDPNRLQWQAEDAEQLFASIR